MKYLLDTHVLDWTVRRDSRLLPEIYELVAQASSEDLAISDVTLSELARHLASGKIQTNFTPAEWLMLAIKNVVILPVTPEIALGAAFLKWETHGQIHRDPADRHIVATAAAHRLPLITCDRQMHAIGKTTGIKVIW